MIVMKQERQFAFLLSSNPLCFAKTTPSSIAHFYKDESLSSSGCSQQLRHILSLFIPSLVDMGFYSNVMQNLVLSSGFAFVSTTTDAVWSSYSRVLEMDAKHYTGSYAVPVRALQQTRGKQKIASELIRSDWADADDFCPPNPLWMINATGEISSFTLPSADLRPLFLLCL